MKLCKEMQAKAHDKNTKFAQPAGINYEAARLEHRQSTAIFCIKGAHVTTINSDKGS